MNLLSLYSGIGGAALAAQEAGMNIVGLCDSDAYCRQVLAKNFPNIPIFMSDETIAEISVPVDIIEGGFPCQGWSLAGKQRGINDPRNRWPRMFELIQQYKPTWVVAENVRGLVSNGGLDIITADLEKEGYETWSLLLPTGFSVGTPHRRERIIIVAYTNKFRSERNKQVAGSIHAGKDAWGMQQVRRTCENVGNPDAQRLQRTEFERVKYDVIEITSKQCSITEREKSTAIESRLGGVLNAVPSGLDAGGKRVAYKGEEQYTWEPPRITSERKNRKERIKALGNSVVPLSLYPIFRSIIEIENAQT